MPFYFEQFPTISYDVKKNNRPVNVQNILLRYKVKEILKDKTSAYYTHIIEDGQTAEFIAHRYYGDETLDWIIYLTNNIFDVIYDWPLDYTKFTAFVKSKYGSVATAQTTTHHYEWIVTPQQTLGDGTVIPEKVLIVDFDTYSNLTASERREVDSYTYEEKKNEAKREIRVLRAEYVDDVLELVESIFGG